MKSTLALALGAALACAPLAHAEDIDLFTGASAGSNVNPRVLIVLDNTSNWSRQSQQWPGGLAQGQAEARAIKTVIASLDSTVSVGLMEFVTGGNANDDGGFIRSAVRPMTDTNRGTFSTQLTTIYNNINDSAEKRNSNTPYGDLMYDVYNYLAGANAYSPNATLSSKGDTGGYVTPFSKFLSPLNADNTCGKTFVIFIGNPSSSGPTADSPANTTALNTINDNHDAKGNLIPVPQLGLPNFSTTTSSTSTTVGTTATCYKSASYAAAELPSFAACSSYTDGCKIGSAVSSASCSKNTSLYSVIGTDTTITNTATGTYSTDTMPMNADEWARVLHDHGVPVANTTIKPSVITYTIDVYNAQPNSVQSSLLMSMAKAGGGRYFAARSEQAIIDALKQIMIEIQAVNQTFASTSLPVNATNRSQNENQVFIGMFRPDDTAHPRWFGNLKRYQLITNGANIELGDVAGQPAVNPLTGFVTPCAASYWTFDSGSYWSGMGVSPDPAGTCTVGGYDKYSDIPDGPFVEKGAAAEILRMGNAPAGTTTSQAVNRTMLTLSGTALVPFTAANTGLDASLVDYIRGVDVNNEKGNGQTTTTRPSIHGDVIHSRPLPINYGGDTGVVVYYGANDGTLRALNAATGVERWSFVAPEFYSRLQRLKDNSPLVTYPNLPAGLTPAPQPKDYFFDGSTGVYQNADSSKVWIYPTMRRGGRMIYALDVSSPGNPQFKWKAGCPNLASDAGCTAGMEGIGQTWSTPNVAFIRGYSTTRPVVVVGGGYDACEDADSAMPSCGSEKGGYIYVLDADDGTLLRSFQTARAVAADVSLVDIDNDGMPDYAYAADTGGALYRVDFISTPGAPVALAPSSWTVRTVARTAGGGRKFLFAPALLGTRTYVYVAIGSGDREHPLYQQYPYANVVNRFYVYKDDLSAPLGTPAHDLDALEDYSSKNDCSTPAVLPNSSLAGWFMNLNQNGQGEQVVTSALIAGGMVTFSTNRPIPPAAGTCATVLGEARGYWVNLLNAAGAINTPGACGGVRSSPFVGGGLPPSPVLASGVPIDGKATTVVIGAAQKGSDGAAGASVSIAPQRLRPTIISKRRRTYSYTKTE